MRVILALALVTALDMMLADTEEENSNAAKGREILHNLQKFNLSAYDFLFER